MAKCNLLKPSLNTDGGTFYTFSQWADDMTIQNALGDAYRIVPSRFACFNISNVSNAGQKLQDYFEHPCAALRHYMEIDTNNGKFTPKEASILFWDAMKQLGVSNPWSNMVYVGEMDLQGTNYIDGVSYSELYCIVPGNAKQMGGWIPGASTPTPGIEFSNAGDYGTPFGWFTLPSGASTSLSSGPVEAKTYYDGPAIFTTDDNQTKYSSLNTLDSLHQIYMKDILTSGNYFDVLNTSDFSFNAIALFYDIVAKDEENNYHYIYTAVPMGMYFSKSGEPIKKYVTNDEVYGQGTSYGLRVTTKFCAESLVSQRGENSPAASISASVNDLYPEMSAVMDRFNAAAEALDDYTEKMQTSLESLTNHLSNFKDNKVNVPYIREIKGPGDNQPEKYWFVNGRSTGVKVAETYNVYYDGTSQDLQTMITNLIDQSITDNSTHLGDVIDNSIANYFDDHSVTQIIESGEFIQFIEAHKYSGDGTIEEIPQIEDYQDIYDDHGENMFNGCVNLKRVPRLELHNATSLKGSFFNCKNLKSLYLADTISCIDFSNTFANCGLLENLVIDATSAEDFDGAFTGCGALRNLRINNLDPTKVNTLDLSQTAIDFASLESIVMSIKSQLYDSSFDSTGPSATITIQVPSNINPDNNFVNDLIYNAQMNKGILVNITN